MTIKNKLYMYEDNHYTIPILDTLDKKILSIIIENARIPFLELARECNVSGASIHQRIQRLASLGVITGSEYILDPTKIGYFTCAFISIRVQNPSFINSTVDVLHKIPEVVECHYTTGEHPIFIKVYAKSNTELKNFLHRKLQSIEGVTSFETIVSLEESFTRQVPVI